MDRTAETQGGMQLKKGGIFGILNNNFCFASSDSLAAWNLLSHDLKKLICLCALGGRT